MWRQSLLGIRAEACLRLAEASWAANNAKAAVAYAWSAFRIRPDDHRTRVVLASLFEKLPLLVEPEMGLALQRLLRDPEIEPTGLSRAGWSLQRRTDGHFESAQSNDD